MVKTHGAEVSFLDAIDMLTISKFHHLLLTRAVQHTGLTVSPPYPLMTSQVLTPPPALFPSPHIHTHPPIPPQEKRLGVGIAYPIHSRPPDPSATAEELQELTHGLVLGTVDFEASVASVIP